MKIVFLIITALIVNMTYSSDIDTLFDAANLMTSKSDTIHLLKESIVTENGKEIDSPMIDSPQSHELQIDNNQIYLPLDKSTITTGLQENRRPGSVTPSGKDKRKTFSHVYLGTIIGISNSHIKSKGLLNYYFEPAAKSINRTAPAFEITLDLFLGDHFSLGTGLAFFNLGQVTKETSVFFSDNIFKHQLQTFSELNYIGVPLLLKYGIKKDNFNITLNCGGIPANLHSSCVKWKIDGRDVEENTILPAVSTTWWDFMFTTGIETGYWFKNNGLLFTGRYLRGGKSIASGIDGTAFNRGYMLGLKYSRRLF